MNAKLVVATVLAVALIFFVLFSGMVWPFAGDHDGRVTQEWCEAHDGRLQTHNVVGYHGGLHCSLENGSLYHVREDGRDVQTT